MKYRYKALQSRRNPDQLDSPLVLAQPHGWVAVFVVLIVTTMLVLWAFLARIPQTVQGQGMLAYPGGTSDIQAPVGGTVEQLDVRQGDRVAKGQDVLRLHPSEGDSTTVKSPAAGRVASVNAQVGSYLPRGQRAVTIELGDSPDAPLQVTTTIPVERAAGVRPDQQVLITVPGVNSRRHGQLRGTVRRVSDVPERQGNQTTRSVLVVLNRKGNAYEWTSGHAPPDPLMPAVPVQISVETARVSPIEILFGGT